MENEALGPEPGAPVDLIGMFRRRWFSGLVAVLVGAGLGVAASTLVETTYHSSTSILVTPTGLPTSTFDAPLARTEQELNLDTESQVLLSQTVAAAAAERAKDSRSLPDLLAAVRVEVPPNTTVLTVVAADRSPARAKVLSHAFAAAYLEHRTSQAEADLAADVKALKSQLGDQQKQLSAVIGPITSLPATSPDRAYAEAQERILTDQITTTSNTINTLSGTEISGGSILSDASTPAPPAFPLRILVVAGGVLLGLLAGWMLMLWRERRDRLVRRPEDLESLAGVPVIGRSVTRGRRAARRAVDSWTALRLDVEGALPDEHAVLLAVPIGAGPLSAYATSSLAASFGRTGARVLVIGADPENARLALFLGVDGVRPETVSPDLPPVRRSTVLGGVWALLADTGEGAELTRSRRLAALLPVLRPAFDLILVHASATEAVALGRSCDRSVLWVQTGHSSYDEVEAAAAQLERRGSPVIGAVLFDARALAAQADAAAAVEERLRSTTPPGPPELAGSQGLTGARELAGAEESAVAGESAGPREPHGSQELRGRQGRTGPSEWAEADRPGSSTAGATGWPKDHPERNPEDYFSAEAPTVEHAPVRPGGPGPGGGSASPEQSEDKKLGTADDSKDAGSGKAKPDPLIRSVRR